MSTRAVDVNNRGSPDLNAALEALGPLFGERLSAKAAVREHHSRDESWHPAALPDAVCFAKTAAEVSRALSICHRHRVPVVPFGTGTGVEGAVVPVHGGICIDTGGLDRIVRVDAEDLTCTVEAGVTRKQLERHLRDTGLFFPIDPGADASLGGMAATRASGTNAVRYGTMRENVLSLTAVLPDGSIVNTGRRAKKSSAGYDLTRLFVGSEGTLGIIVELTLRLYGRPEAMSAARVYFDSVDAAVETTIQVLQFGIPIARIELLDEAQMDAINRYSNTDYPLKPALFLEFHGSESAVREQVETVGEICAGAGGSDFEWAVHEEDRALMWQARHDAAYAAMAMRPGARAYATDVCVPISRLAECIRETRRDVSENWTQPSFLLGHVGDGNFHYVFLLDPEQPDEYRTVQGIGERMVRRAIELGGTCTGEHGIGLGKQQYLEPELGAEAVALMRTIKRAIDPHNIMNPAKVLPP